MAVVMRLRAELRSSRRSWIATALFVGLIAGVVIAAAAAAHRTDTAVPRSAAASNFSDVSVAQFGRSGIDYDRLKRLPSVSYSYRSDNLMFTGRTDAGRPLDPAKAGMFATADASVGTTRDAPALVEGRRADSSRMNEVVPDEDAARMLGLHLGSTFTARFATADQAEDFLATTGDPSKFPTKGPTETFKVVGISASFPSPTANYPRMQLTSGFYRAHGDRIARAPDFGVYLAHGKADLPRFSKDVEALARGEEVTFHSKGDFVPEVQRGVRIQAAALWVLAALAGVVGLVAVAQAVARQTASQAADFPTLRAIGMTSRQLIGLALARAGVIGLLGALIGAALAVVLSPIGPVGALARKAEPHPGLSVDVLIVAGGALLTVLLLVGVAAVPAWRAVRGSGPSSEHDLKLAGRPSAIAGRLARAGLPLAVVGGARMALERNGGGSGVPVMSVLGGSAVAIAAIAATLTFGASLDRLVSTPRLYGQTWDAQFGDDFDPDLAKRAYPLLRRNGYVAGFAGGTVGDASVAGARVGVLALEQARGSVGPSVIEGKVPVRPNEILLDGKTLDQIGAEVGDFVPIRGGGRSIRMRVVGEGVISDVEGATPLLGRGAMLTFAGYRRLASDAPRNFFFVRFRKGVDERKALASLRDVEPLAGSEPVDVANYDRIDSMPAVTGALLGLMALATLAHALLASVRSRRRELAILKTLGFEPTQISGMVAFQAITILAIGVVIGAPLGWVAGGLAWTWFADGLGVVPDAVVPVTSTLVLLPAALVLGLLVAALPARMAARTRPALVLRAG